VVLDYDADGAATEEEFAFGTDPLNPASYPPRMSVSADGASFEIPVVAGVSFGSALLLTSTNLLDWETVPGFPPASPGVFTIAGNLDERVRFFTIGAPSLLNSDGDCLLDFEELNLFHTDPFKTDTDGDDDCTEVNVFHTDPNVASITGRGAIAGRVVLDEDKDPATQTHPGIQGWRVFLDLDYDSEFDLGEPNAVSQADGTYLIRELDPGFYRVRIEPRVAWLQVFPVLTPTPIPDGYPDRVVEVFDSGAGPIPFPYGRYPDPLPGLRLVFPSPPPDPVDASVVLGVLPASPIAGPYGGWAHVDMLAIPSNSFVTVAFDGEEIFDGPGPDLTIWTAADGPDETVEMYLGATASNLVSAGVIAQNASIPVDLADVGIKTPVRYVKLLGQGLLGTYPGFDLVGFEALHYRPLNRGHYDVEVQGGLTTGDLNFGVAGDDRPPKVMISTDQTDVRAGESLTAQVTASDDLGVASVQLNANGIAVPLSAQFQGTFTVQSGGLLTLAATATDTANQQGSTLLTLIARNEDGSLPDLSGLGISGGDGGTGGPSIQLVSPVSGEILAAPHNVIGSIIGSTAAVASWRLEYAPADLVNPEALDAPDADYILLAEGSGQAIGSSLGTLQGDTMPAGAYLLRVSASDINGTTRYFGFVFGVRIDPLDLRPEVVLTTPTNEATLTYSAAIQGSITTRQALREWYVEYAPLSQVNLNHISDNKPAWTRIGSGTEAVTNDILATFDTTLISDDSYVIRVSAWNKNGQGWAEPVLVHVAGGAKLGNFAVEFTDLSLPLAGIPVVIKRVYNSLTAQRPADFGYGWSLAVQNADIAETVPQTGTGLGSTPFRVGARVYLTAPDGKRVGFTFEPEIGAASFLGAAYKAVFKPDPGVVYKLSVPEGDAPFLSLNSNGELALFFVPLPWNPDRYVLTDTDGTSYTYDQFDGLIEAEDLNGNRVSFTDQAITHSAGPELRFTRDGAGRITAITAPDGQVWQYAYSTNGDLVAVTYPGNLSGTFGYSSERPHFLETIADPVRGPTLRTEYDDAGRVTAIIDAAGNRTSQEWDVGSFTGTFIDARGNVTKLTYDSRGNLTRREDPLGGVTTWEYKDASNPSVPTALVTPNGHRTTFVYSTAGTLLERRTPIARTFHTYDEDHNLTRTQYGTGGSETYRRDAMGNLLHIDSQHGDLSFTYTGSGLLASVLDGEGGLTRLEYEGGLSVPSRLVLPDGTVKQFTYDSYGRIVEYTDPAGGVQRYEYDASGRLTRTVDSNGAQQQTTYDAAFPHQPATVTDGAGRVTRYTYDNLGRLATETGPGGGVTRYEYNADGHRTAVVDPLNNRYEFSYDALGRLVEETDPLGNKRTHQYDLEGNRIVTVDRNARKRGFTYDAHNRMKTEEWIEPMGTGVVRTIRYDYDRIDQLTKVTDEGAILQFGTMYVPDGPLTSETMQYPGGTERRVAYVLDSAGRREGVQLTTTSPVLEPALSINYVRDLAGRLRILENRHPLPPTKVTDSAFQMQFWRNARGDIEELRRFTDQTGQNRVSQTFLNYSDPCACRLDSIEHIIATNQPMAEAAMAFVRSAGDRLNQIQDGTNTLTFDYDPAGQLIGASRN
jgi:YD repeat-containing protein